MGKRSFLASLTVLLAIVSLSAQKTMTGSEILQASDKKLLPTYCSYALNLETTEVDGSKSVNTLDGYKRDSARNVMLVTSPKKVAGSVHMRKELVIWSYHITDKKLVKQAYSSSFMGTLLNYGDVMATELSYDYDVVDTKTTDKYYVLTLKVKAGHDGYAKVVVTINKSNLYPEKREFYALSGELNKTCELVTLNRSGDKTTLMKQKYSEPLKKRISVATYDNVEYLGKDDIPDRYYNENEIKSLSGE